MAHATFCFRVPPWYLYSRGFKWPSRINPIEAQNQGSPPSGPLFSRVADLIKMAFTASTAYVAEIRLTGLVVLRDVIGVRTVLWLLFLVFIIRKSVDICYISWPRVRRRASLRTTSSTYYCCPHTCILLWFDAWNFGFCCSRMCCLRGVRCSEGRWKNGSHT